MTALAELTILDLRPQLPRNPKADPDLGTFAAKTSVTLHYNGPAVRGAGNRDEELHQLTMDASYHIGKIWGYAAGRALYGNGIMYHFAVLSDGTICQLRNLDCVLWHCANGSGNRASMSVHLPLGEGQTPTAAQWTAFTRLSDALIADYHMAGRSKVLGHTEWPKYDANGHQIPNSACPGTILLPMLRTWRTATPVSGLTIRTAPRIDSTVFRAVLAAYNSPCVSIAQQCYDIIVQNSLDPAVALAFFGHESIFGTVGRAVTTLNWGNVRTPFNPTRATVVGGFAVFPDWPTGLQDWCERINERYINERGLATVEQVIPVYAPSSDGNDVQAYIDHVRTLVTRWQQQGAA